MAVQSSVITRDIEKIAAQTGNIYESVVVISKRARQIAVNNAIAKAAEAQQGYEELTKDALKTKAQELSERQKSLEIMEAERFLQDDLAELSAQKIIAEQEAAKRKLAIEEMTRDQLLNTVSATERLLKTSQEGTQIELANSRAVMKVYEEQAKKRDERLQKEK